MEALVDFKTEEAQTVWVSGCACNEVMEIGEVCHCHGNYACEAQVFGVSPTEGRKTCFKHEEVMTFL